MIKIENLTKKFKGRTVINDVTVTLEFGNIYGFIGTNGSGKSVFFKLLCGFLKPDSGVISYNDKIVGKEIDFIPDMGVLIERPGFIENYSHIENLKYLASIKHNIGEDEIKHYIKLVGLELENQEKVKNYSLGMRQRLAIAQAIMEDQKVIILDEPFNGLDKRGRSEIKEVLKALRAKDRMVLITSHIEGDIEDLADLVYEFSDGILYERE